MSNIPANEIDLTNPNEIRKLIKTNKDVIDNFIVSAKELEQEINDFEADPDLYCGETDYYLPKISTLNCLIHVFFNMYDEWLLQQNEFDKISHPKFINTDIVVRIQDEDYNKLCIQFTNLNENEDFNWATIDQSDSLYISNRDSWGLNYDVSFHHSNSWIMNYLFNIDRIRDKEDVADDSCFSNEILILPKGV